MTQGISKFHELHEFVSSIGCKYGLPSITTPGTFYFYQEDISASSDNDQQNNQAQKVWRCIYADKDNNCLELVNIESLNDKLNAHLQDPTNNHLPSPESLFNLLADNNQSMLYHLAEIVRKSYKPEVLASIVEQGETLLKTRFPRDYRLMSEASKKAERIRLLTLQLALGAQIQRTDLHEPDENKKEKYQNLQEKTRELLDYLQKIKTPPAFEVKKPIEKSMSGFGEYVGDRFVSWFMPKDTSPRGMLVYVRDKLDDLTGSDFNWAYKQSNPLLKTSKNFVKTTSYNPWGFEAEQAKRNMQVTREARQYIKSNSGLAIFLLDLAIAGMDAAKGGFEGDEASALEQLPPKTKLKLWNALFKNIVATTNFWVTFQYGSDDIPGNMSVKEHLGVLSLFGAIFQLGAMMQYMKTNMDARDTKQDEIALLKSKLDAANKGSAEAILLQTSLKQAEKELRGLHAELRSSISSALMIATKISLGIIAMSFAGPAAPIIPVAIAIVGLAMDLIQTAVKGGLGIYETKQEKKILEAEMEAAYKELDALNKPNRQQTQQEKQLVIGNILELRQQIQALDNAIDQQYFLLFRTLAVQLIVDSIRTVAVSLLPFGWMMGVMAATKVFQKLTEVITDYITEPEPVNETLPYTLEKIPDLNIPDGAGTILTLEQAIKPYKLYIESDQANKEIVHYAVRLNGTVHQGTIHLKDDLNLQATEEDLKNLPAFLEPWLANMLVITDAKGHTNMLEQLRERDGKVKPAVEQAIPVAHQPLPGVQG